MAYLSPNPAVTLLGTTRSANLMMASAAGSEIRSQNSLSNYSKSKGLEVTSQTPEGPREAGNKTMTQQKWVPETPVQPSRPYKQRSSYPIPISARTSLEAPIKASSSTTAKGQAGSKQQIQSQPHIRSPPPEVALENILEDTEASLTHNTWSDFDPSMNSSSSATSAYYPSTKKRRSPPHNVHQTHTPAASVVSSSSLSQPVKPDIADLARKFKMFYPKYAALYKEIVAMNASNERDVSKEQDLLEMHARLESMKRAILASKVENESSISTFEHEPRFSEGSYTRTVLY